MSIDLSTERLLTFNEASEYLPGGIRPSISTWWRWWRKGVRGIRLATVVVGGRRFVTVSAIMVFIEQLTAADHAPLAATANSAKLRERELEAAEHESDRDGL